MYTVVNRLTTTRLTIICTVPIDTAVIITHYYPSVNNQLTPLSGGHNDLRLTARQHTLTKSPQWILDSVLKMLELIIG